MVRNPIASLRDAERGVSPVIGVILMVAVTVVLAAVIGGFVFGMGDSLNNPAPNAQFDTNFNGDVLTITHNGGETLNSDNTGSITIDTDADAADVTGFTLDVTAGDQATVGTAAGSTPSYADVVWESPDGGTSQVLFEWEAP